MRTVALVAWSLFAGCVESDHDRIANEILAAHESLHELLFMGTPEASCGGETLSGGPGTDGIELSLPPCTAHTGDLETRALALELIIPPVPSTETADQIIHAYDLVYDYGDESFRGTHFIFTEYAFFTISVDDHNGTDRHAMLDGTVTVDGVEVDFSKESFVLP